jgi:sugar/nucleoside kinase (ribokinase family)
VGDDPLGRIVEEEITAAGVTPHALRLPGYRTAKNLSLTVEGEDRRFVAELSANTELTSSHVEEALRSIRPTVFYLGTVGGLRRIDPELPRLLEAARSLGAATFVDVIMPTGDWSHLAPAYRHMDWLHLNGAEATAATGLSDPAAAAERLTSLGVGTSVVSLGSGGLVACDVERIYEVPAFRVEEVDSTGAGDALCAGLIHAVRGGRSLRDTLVEASAAGAACVTATGATPGVTRGNVDRLLREQRGNVEAGIRVHR